MAKSKPLKPEPLDDNKKKQLMILGVAGLMVVIVLGWFYSLPYLLDRPQDTDMETDQTVTELKTAFEEVKNNFGQIKAALETTTATDSQDQNIFTNQDLDKLTAAVVEKQTADWKSYSAFDYKFAFKYPANWTVDSQTTDKTWQLTDDQQTANIVFTVSPTADIASQTGGLTYTIGQQNGQLYQDATSQKLIINLPDSDLTLTVTGTGQNFQLLLATITFLK